MKAILVTRLDGAVKTHDLLKLYRELPDDSRRRLEGDFLEIADVLGHSRETFGRWRYFEQGIGEDAIRALEDTDRLWGLGKAARVIADECVVAGLNYEIDIDTSFEFDWRPGDMSTAQRTHLSLEGGESSIPWRSCCRPERTTNQAAVRSRRGSQRRRIGGHLANSVASLASISEASSI